MGHTRAVEQEEWGSNTEIIKAHKSMHLNTSWSPGSFALLWWLWRREERGGKKKKSVREEEFKLMLRYKLLSARGTGEEKNISSWLKGLRTRKGNIGEDKLWALKGKGSLEKQKAEGKAARKQSRGMQGERDSILALAVSCFSLFKKKTGRRDRWEGCLQQDKTEIHTPLDNVLAYFCYDRRPFRQGIF